MKAAVAIGNISPLPSPMAWAKQRASFGAKFSDFMPFDRVS
jgi:hypothetical protein